MTVLAAMVGWLAGLAVMGRCLLPNRGGAASDPSAAGSATADLTIIIPARNEAATIGRLLDSIGQQDCRPAQVVVVNDHSSDNTAALARAAGATVLDAPPLPAGWLGKPWACQQGAEAANASLLLFLDADTWLQPGGLRQLLQLHRRRGAVVSVLPFHVAPTNVEQQSAFFNLIMAAGIGAFTAWPRETDGLFGQMLLIDRPTYHSVGGHAAVRGHVLENLHLARHLRRLGVTLHCALGKGVLCMRMYPGGWSDLVRGWSKGFASGAGRTHPAIMLLIILWLSGAMMAGGDLVQHHNTPAVAVYVLFVVQLRWMLRQIGSFGWAAALLYPLPLLLFFGLFARSALQAGRSVQWKGRAVRAT